MSIYIPLFMAIDIFHCVFHGSKVSLLLMIWISSGMPVEYITVRVTVVRHGDPVMTRPSAMNRHIVTVHMENDVLRCFAIQTGQIFLVEHSTSLKNSVFWFR